MKKSYITPEIIFMEADACELLSASNKPDQSPAYYVGGGQEGTSNKEHDSVNLATGDDWNLGAKQGDFFCNNFEYDFDF